MKFITEKEFKKAVAAVEVEASRQICGQPAWPLPGTEEAYELIRQLWIDANCLRWLVLHNQVHKDEDTAGVTLPWLRREVLELCA